jgi:aldehyde:ferredoxin oxidoreductase
MTSPTGAEHMSNLHDTALTNKASISQFKHLGILEPMPLESLSPQKIRALLYQVNLRLMVNSLCMCQFMPWDVHQLNMILRASTGMKTTSWELMKIGERVNTMTRIFNLREGLGINDDNLPERFYYPTSSGALSDTALDVDDVKKAKEIYYRMMGWNEKGIPRKNKLEEISLSWASKYL